MEAGEAGAEHEFDEGADETFLQEALRCTIVLDGLAARAYREAIAPMAEPELDGTSGDGAFENVPFEFGKMSTLQQLILDSTGTRAWDDARE